MIAKNCLQLQCTHNATILCALFTNVEVVVVVFPLDFVSFFFSLLLIFFFLVLCFALLCVFTTVLVQSKLRVYKYCTSKDCVMSNQPPQVKLPQSVRVVIGITTIPERLHKGLLQRSLQSLLSQDLADHIVGIVVNIPAVSIKGKPYDKNIAMELKKMDPNKIVVNYGVSDDGPITKLLPTLSIMDQRFGGKGESTDDIWVCLADDDTVYSPNMLSNLLAQAQLSDVAVGFAGRHGFMSMFAHGVSNRTEAIFLETFAGVAYKRGVFGPVPAFTQWLTTLPENAIFVDDIVIGAWFSKQQKKMYMLPLGQLDGDMIKHDPSDTPELRSGNLMERNIKVQRALQQQGYFPELTPKDPMGHVVMGAVDFAYGTLNNVWKAGNAFNDFWKQFAPPPQHSHQQQQQRY
jgi:hypothetical protein